MDQKTILFSILMMCLLVCVFAVSLIQPFFPPFAKERGVSDLMIGIIFGVNPLGAMCVNIPVTKHLTQSNQFKFMFCGLFMQSIGLFLFAATQFVDKVFIIILSLIGRAINGIGMCFYLNPLFAAIPQIYPDTIVKKMAITNIFIAQGFMFGRICRLKDFKGPAIGSFLYEFVGYWFPFLFFGVIPLILIPALNTFISNIGINNQQPETVKSQDNDEQTTPLVSSDQSPDTNSIIQRVGQTNSMIYILQQNDKPIPLGELIKSYPIVIYTFTIFLVNFQFNFFGPIIASFFITQFNSAVSHIGWYIAYMNIFYILAGLLCGYVKKNQNMVQGKSIQQNFFQYIFISAITSGIGCIFMGPDQLTGINQKFIITLIAYAIIGGSAAIMQVFILSLLNQVLIKKFPQSKDICNNIASGIYTLGTYMGEFIGPITSGIISSKLSLERTISILGLIFFIYSLFFIPMLFQKKKTEEIQIETKSIVF